MTKMETTARVREARGVPRVKNWVRTGSKLGPNGNRLQSGDQTGTKSKLVMSFVFSDRCL